MSLQTTLRRFLFFETVVGLETVSPLPAPGGSVRRLAALPIDTGLGHGLGDVALSFAEFDLGLMTRGLDLTRLDFASCVLERTGLPRWVRTTSG